MVSLLEYTHDHLTSGSDYGKNINSAELGIQALSQIAGRLFLCHQPARAHPARGGFFIGEQHVNDRQ